MMRQLFSGMEVVEEEEEYRAVEEGRSVLARTLARLQRWVRRREPLQGDMRSAWLREHRWHRTSSV